MNFTSCFTLCFTIILTICFVSTCSGTLLNIKKVIHFPDPKQRGFTIPAIIDGVSPFLNGNEVKGRARDVRFFLLTSADSETAVELPIGQLTSLESSNYVKDAPWKIMIHGFGASYKDSFPWDVARTYFTLGKPLNIILVDWSDLAASPWYIDAVANVDPVGRRTADLVRFLVQQDVINGSLDDLHIIGYSLGAHVAGHSGSVLGSKVARITALDPALPCFEDVSTNKRIDPSDARFVDVIHTAGGFPWANGLSLFIPCGHVDFYPNNGRSQPGCEGESFGVCSHERAVEYFQESLQTETGFYSCKCKDWDHFQAGTCNFQNLASMGFSTQLRANGTYYLRTASHSPFALGKTGLKSIKVF